MTSGAPAQTHARLERYQLKFTDTIPVHFRIKQYITLLLESVN